MKYIKSRKIYESDYNYHRGTLKGDLKPHYSDNIFFMSGRSTGHFGSGMYFSTYREEDKEYDQKYRYSYKSSPELIQVDDSVYRVDLDIYKNLFKVNSKKQAEFLFKTLKSVNHTFYYYQGCKDESLAVPLGLSKRYLIIKNNFEELGLKVPEYKKFLNMLDQACEDYDNGRHGKKEVNIASFSTRLMEFNGFNGVNVSGISGYDNTTHGSVIYDINKLSSEPIEVKNIDFMSDIDNTNVIGSYKNPKANLLKNSTLFFDEISSLSIKDQIIYIKRFEKYLPVYLLDKLSPQVKNAYIKSLPFKIKNNLMEGEPTPSDIELLVDNNYINIILDKNIMVGNNTLLCHVLAILWKIPNEYQKLIFNSINRELDEDEQYYYDNFKENWLIYLD